MEQERRRTEGEWRRIEDDLARMEEERLRERSGSIISTTFFIFSFRFLHEICEISPLFGLARLYFFANFAQIAGLIIFVAF